MPVVRYYEVEETRVVKIRANSTAEAAQAASMAFRGELQEDNGITAVTEPIRATELRVRDLKT